MSQQSDGRWKFFDLMDGRNGMAFGVAPSTPPATGRQQFTESNNKWVLAHPPSLPSPSTAGRGAGGEVTRKGNHHDRDTDFQAGAWIQCRHRERGWRTHRHDQRVRFTAPEILRSVVRRIEHSARDMSARPQPARRAIWPGDYRLGRCAAAPPLSHQGRAAPCAGDRHTMNIPVHAADPRRCPLPACHSIQDAGGHVTTNQLTLIDPALIDPNPYQPGTRLEFTPENLADLESIREKLLQPFIVRPHPDAAGRYQQSFGHRRLAAWKLYRFGEPIPCYVEDLEDLDDRAMFRQMVLENEQRLDTNSIEKALTLQAYIQAFGVTQAEAGQLYGLRTQSAVSNLLRLLQLPDPIQAYVAAGEVPERLARLLIPIARIFPQDAARIAQAIAQAEGNNKQMAGEEGIEHLLRQRGRPPWAAVWEPGGATRPMSTDTPGGHPSL